MAKQLQSIKATGAVKELVRPTPNGLMDSNQRDQLDPTWQLILPNGNPWPLYALIVKHQPAKQHKDAKQSSSSSEKSPPLSQEDPEYSSPSMNTLPSDYMNLNKGSKFH